MCVSGAELRFELLLHINVLNFTIRQKCYINVIRCPWHDFGFPQQVNVRLTTEDPKTRIRTKYTWILKLISFTQRWKVFCQHWEEKCTEWPQNDRDMFKIKSTHMHTTCTYTSVFSTTNCFRATVVFLRNMTPEWPRYVQGQNYPYPICIRHTPRGLHFRLFCSTMSRFRITTPNGEMWENFGPFLSAMIGFRVMFQLGEQSTAWPQSEPTSSRSTVQTLIHVHNSYAFNIRPLAGPNFRQLCCHTQNTHRNNVSQHLPLGHTTMSDKTASWIRTTNTHKVVIPLLPHYER